VQALARWLCTYGVVQGIFVIAGGRKRWSGSSFETALLVPGAPASWGWALLVIGLAGIICSLRGRIRGVALTLYGVTVWFAFFTISLGKTALEVPEAATTGVVTYGALAVISAVLGSAHWFSAQTGSVRSDALQKH
jgi:hypothetical protein